MPKRGWMLFVAGWLALALKLSGCPEDADQRARIIANEPALASASATQPQPAPEAQRHPEPQAQPQPEAVAQPKSQTSPEPSGSAPHTVKPRARTLHPQPGANECVEMYGFCTQGPDRICTTKAFVLGCGEHGKHPETREPVHCECP